MLRFPESQTIFRGIQKAAVTGELVRSTAWQAQTRFDFERGL